jgi:hypothetical protein
MGRSLRGHLNNATSRGRTATCLPLDVGQLPNKLPALRGSVKGRESACRSRTVGDPSHLSNYGVTTTK